MLITFSDRLNWKGLCWVFVNMRGSRASGIVWPRSSEKLEFLKCIVILVKLPKICPESISRRFNTPLTPKKKIRKWVRTLEVFAQPFAVNRLDFTKMTHGFCIIFDRDIITGPRHFLSQIILTHFDLYEAGSSDIKMISIIHLILYRQ